MTKRGAGHLASAMQVSNCHQQGTFPFCPLFQPLAPLKHNENEMMVAVAILVKLWLLFLLIACLKGCLSAAKRAFLCKEVQVRGSLFIRGKWAFFLGFVFSVFAVFFAVFLYFSVLPLFK